VINLGSEEGLYTAEFKYFYIDGDEHGQENVTKHVLLCYDTNSPSLPSINEPENGNKHFIISWSKSTDSLELDSNQIFFQDPNFHESIKEYELKIWKETEDPNEGNSELIDVYYDGNGIQQGEYSFNYDDGVENNSTYNIKIRSRDKAGNYSEWSQIEEARPYRPLGLIDLTGEKSKCFIDSIENEKKEKEGNNPRWVLGFRGDNHSFQDPNIEVVYNGDSYGGRIEIGYRSCSWIENTLEIGYYQMSGGIHPETREKSIDKYYFHILPLSTTIRILPFKDRNWFINPYIGVGYDCWFYQEDYGDSDFESYLTGYHGVFALRFLMNKLDPTEAKSFKENYGIKKTYLTIGAQWNQIDDFSDEEGLDLSGQDFFITMEVLF